MEERGEEGEGGEIRDERREQLSYRGKKKGSIEK